MKFKHKTEELSLTKNYKLFLNRKLGNGAFGEIYKGEEISTHKKIAVKCETVQEKKSSTLNENVVLSGNVVCNRQFDVSYSYVIS